MPFEINDLPEPVAQSGPTIENAQKLGLLAQRTAFTPSGLRLAAAIAARMAGGVASTTAESTLAGYALAGLLNGAGEGLGQMIEQGTVTSPWDTKFNKSRIAAESAVGMLPFGGATTAAGAARGLRNALAGVAARKITEDPRDFGKGFHSLIEADTYKNPWDLANVAIGTGMGAALGHMSGLPVKAPTIAPNAAEDFAKIVDKRNVSKFGTPLEMFRQHVNLTPDQDAALLATKRWNVDDLDRSIAVAASKGDQAMVDRLTNAAKEAEFGSTTFFKEQASKLKPAKQAEELATKKPLLDLVEASKAGKVLSVEEHQLLSIELAALPKGVVAQAIGAKPLGVAATKKAVEADAVAVEAAKVRQAAADEAQRKLDALGLNDEKVSASQSQTIDTPTGPVRVNTKFINQEAEDKAKAVAEAVRESKAAAKRVRKNSPTTPDDTIASVPFMITRTMRQTLQNELGYTEDAVDAMTPGLANTILKDGVKAAPIAAELSPAAKQLIELTGIDPAEAEAEVARLAAQAGSKASETIVPAVPRGFEKRGVVVEPTPSVEPPPIVPKSKRVRRGKKSPLAEAPPTTDIVSEAGGAMANPTKFIDDTLANYTELDPKRVMKRPENGGGIVATPNVNFTTTVQVMRKHLPDDIVAETLQDAKNIHEAVRRSTLRQLGSPENPGLSQILNDKMLAMENAGRIPPGTTDIVAQDVLATRRALQSEYEDLLKQGKAGVSIGAGLGNVPEMLDMFKRNPAFAAHLLGAGVGAGIGAASSDDDKVGGAMLGGLAGGIAPALLKNAHMPTLEDVNAVARNIPSTIRGALLLDKYRLPINTFMAPWGSGILGSAEMALGGAIGKMMGRGDDGSVEVGLRGLNEMLPHKYFNPKKWHDAYKEAVTAVGDVERGDQVWSDAPNMFQKYTSVPATLMSMGDRRMRNAGSVAGMTDLETKLITNTSNPHTGPGSWAAKSMKTAPPLIQMMLPFYKTTTNVVEGSVERTPGIGWIVHEITKKTDMHEMEKTAQQMIAQQGMGAAVGYIAYKLGENLDPTTVKERRINSLITNSAGQYGVIAGAAFLAGQAHQLGKDPVKAAISSASNALPLPTMEIPSDIAKWAAGKGPTKGEYLEKYLPKFIIPGPLQDKGIEEYKKIFTIND